MELSDVVGTQFAFHGIVVGFVIILAVLVFAFGFKTAEEPPFDKLTTTSDDRKPAGKKRKVKDKKSQSNGHATTVSNEEAKPKQKSSESTGGKTGTPKSGSKPVKEEKRESEKLNVKETTKAGKQDKKQQKSDVIVKPALKENKNIKENKNEIKPPKKQEKGGKDVKNQLNKNKGKENVSVEAKNKKNAEKSQKSKKVEEKPQDFDEGEWEQASYRKDRKKTRVVNVDEDTAGDKTGEKKVVSSPSKKKPTKATGAPSEVTNFIDEEKKTAAKKETNKKEKKSAPQSEEVADFLAAESENKSAAKKNDAKKKVGKNESENNAPAEKIIENEIAAKITEVAAPKVIPEPVTKVLDDNVAVFDDFADACPEKWKEPKTSKKSNNRKKVRKDQ